MVLPITRKYAKSLCDKFNKVPKRYASSGAASSSLCRPPLLQSERNKMKINRANPQKSKDFQGAQTKPKNIPTFNWMLVVWAAAAPIATAAPAAAAALWLPSRSGIFVGVPHISRHVANTCVQQPPLKWKGTNTTTRAQARCECVCVWLCTFTAALLKVEFWAGALIKILCVANGCSCCCLCFPPQSWGL